MRTPIVSLSIALSAATPAFSIACSSREAHPPAAESASAIRFGQPDLANQYPHTGAIGIPSRVQADGSFCSVVRIGRRSLLTAGHCILHAPVDEYGIGHLSATSEPLFDVRAPVALSFSPREFQDDAVAGESASTVRPKEVSFERIVLHPSIDATLRQISTIVDVALMTAHEDLAAMFPASRSIGLSRSFGGDYTIVGYGYHDADAGVSGVRHVGSVSVADFWESCERTRLQIVGAEIKGGDSGGALVNAMGRLVGVLSTEGTFCGNAALLAPPPVPPDTDGAVVLDPIDWVARHVAADDQIEVDGVVVRGGGEP